MEQHQIRPVIDREYAFAELPQALEDLDRGGHFGKLVVNITA